MILMNIKNKIYEFSNGNRVINVTPHTLAFVDGDETKFIEPSGLLVSAKLIKVNVSGPFVTEKCVGDDYGAMIIQQIKEIDCDVIIIGSSVAAGAFPMKVAAACEIEGYKSVPKGQRKYSVDEFRVIKERAS